MVKIDESYFNDEPLSVQSPAATFPSEEGDGAELLQAAPEPLSEPERIDVEEALGLSDDFEADAAEHEEPLGDPAQEEEPAPEEPAPRKGGRRHNLWYWLGGDMLAQPSFRKYIPAFVTIMLMALIHVAGNYQMISKRRQVDKLEVAVQRATYKRMEAVGELTRLSFGTNLEQQIKAMGSELEAPEQPPIVIRRDKD